MEMTAFRVYFSDYFSAYFSSACCADTLSAGVMRATANPAEIRCGKWLI